PRGPDHGYRGNLRLRRRHELGSAHQQLTPVHRESQRKLRSHRCAVGCLSSLLTALRPARSAGLFSWQARRYNWINSAKPRQAFENRRLEVAKETGIRSNLWVRLIV